MSNGFRLTLGAYSTGNASAKPVSLRRSPVLFNGFHVSTIVTIQAEAWVYATGPGNVSTAMAALEAAAAVPNIACGIEYHNGTAWTATAHWLPTSGAIGSVRVADLAWEGGDLHLATEAKANITLEAEYGNASETAGQVLLRESVTILGEGGAITPLAPQAGAVSVRQQTADYSDVTVIQQGSLEGRTGYPSLPSFLIATAGARQVTQTRDVKSVQQKRLALYVYRRDYSFTFTLDAHPGTVNPNVLV